MRRQWQRDNGEFRISTCRGVAAYIFHKTGIKVHAHKTEKYLYITYTKNNKLENQRMLLRGGVLYCFEEKDFDALIAEMMKPSTQKTLLGEAQGVILMFDQANTGEAIVNLGHRGQLLASAVEDLRKMCEGSLDQTAKSFTWRAIDAE